MLGPQPNRPRNRRRSPMERVEFPVAPMLDMAFQLLAFFILTFQAPGRETGIDLYLPAAPASVSAPVASEDLVQSAQPPPEVPDLETDLVVRAESDELGDLTRLTLQGTEVPDPPTLGQRLERYQEQLRDEPVRIRLVADDRLRYDEAAKLISACAGAGVDAVRLAGPSGQATGP